MLLAAVLLSATLAPPEAPKTPAPKPPAERAGAPSVTAKPAKAPPAATGAEAPATEAPQTKSAAPAGSHLEAGLAAFRRHRLAAARAELEQAVADDPQSAAAAYYLGYAYYKIGEPSRHMNENKEHARELFAKAFSLDPTFTPAWGARSAAKAPAAEAPKP